MLYDDDTPYTIHLSTNRLFIRTINQDDSQRLADYYSENASHLKPWEPKRDQSFYLAAGWQIRIKTLMLLQQQDAVRCFLLLDKLTNELRGVINYSHIIKGDFQACYLGYSLAEKAQGKGLMREALTATLHEMFEQQQLHRIMANYMPQNQRSGHLLETLGFEKEGYAKNYLRIDGKWQDHVLTALTNHY